MRDESVLAARQYLYRTYQCLLGSEPKGTAFEAFDVELFEEACAMVGVGVPKKMVDLYRDARESATCREALQSEYVRALVGPGKLPSAPWESAQLSGDGALFSRQTLDVRNAYRVQGFLPQEYPRVADDHIALECGFLAEMAARALERQEAGDEQGCTEALAASQAFLEEHPLLWVNAFADGLDEQRYPFYRAVAEALAALMDADSHWLASEAGDASSR